SNPPEGERAGLWFELARSKLLKNDIAGAIEAFGSLAGVPGGAFLGQILRAYAIPRSTAPQGDASTDPARDASALEALSDLATDPGTSRAFQIAAALRYQLSGKLDEAILDLSAMHEAEPADLIVATALATLLRRQGEASRAADTLASAATNASNEEVAAA